MYINNDVDYINYLKKKKIYIFGCGGGKSYANKLKNYNIVSFIDNDPNRQQTICLGYPVIGIKDFKERNTKDAMIVIGTVYEKEIKEQLLSMGIFNFISGTQIDFGGGAEHYDEKYFEWQRTLGQFGAKKKIAYFAPYIREWMTVVEFGSGGGYLLEEVNVKEKVGIEINDAARNEMQRRNLSCVKYTKDLPDESVDLIISTSVLEHCENPFLELKELRKKLREGGLCVFHVPNEPCETEYTKSEINNHLYTWNCLNIGNLFKAAGFFVKSVERIISEWPNHFEKIDKEVSAELFDDLCELKGFARNNSITSCLIVACK